MVMSSEVQRVENLFAAQQVLLTERLQIILASLHFSLIPDVVCALEGSGKLLSLSHSQNSITNSDSGLPAGYWPLLTLLVAQQCDPNINLTCAASVAVAIECFICALDLLDDVEDGDQTATLQALGEARTLNVSTTLLVLAQRIILSTSEHQVSPERILRLLDTLQEATLTATGGQHRDLLAEQQSALEITQEDCIEIARGKAGALIRLTCRLGALCAGAEDALCELFSELGELLGIAQQLDNDAHDLYYLLQDHPSQTVSTPTENTPRSVKTDLVRGKKTLPVVIAAQRNQSLQNAAVSADEMSEEQIQALHEGIIATWGVSLLYHERARERFQAIEAQHPIAPALRMLLNL
jgi:geranylgeranyl pyrophosphate synthase